MGRGAAEKTEIGARFAELAAGSDLVLDIGLGEEDRLYEEEWPRFLASCKAMLGVESGASCVDLEDEVRAEYEALAAEGREPTLEELERGALGRIDGEIPYRTISPRHFEAAALRVTQILFEGDYSGAMEPMRHYIPLKKDFSNFDEVVERFRDPELRRELTENARRELIDSGDYSYERFVAGFDAVLAEAGIEPGEGDAAPLPELRRSAPARGAHALRSTLSYHPRLSRMLWRVSRGPLGAYRRLARSRAERKP